MYNFKKIAALGLAFTMVFGSTVTAFATDPDPAPASDPDITATQTEGTEVTGTGTEDYVNKNVMRVTLPTAEKMATIFDYRLDPQGLIAQSKSYAGTAVTGTASGVVFLNTASGKSVISNTSDPFTITNKSSIPVDMEVSVVLEAAQNNPLALTTVSSTSDFTSTDSSGNTTPNGKAIYFGLKATNDVERALSDTAITPNTTLLSGASQYTATWVAGANAGDPGEYTWAPIANPKWKDYAFTVTGAINKALANDTWATIDSDGKVTTNNPPTIKLSVKLTAVEDTLPVTLKWTTDSSKNDILQIAKASAATGTGGFVANEVTKLYVNGREIPETTTQTGTVPGFAVDEKGYLTVSLAKIYDGEYGDWDDADAKAKTAAKALIKSAKAITSGPVFYGEF